MATTQKNVPAAKSAAARVAMLPTDRVVATVDVDGIPGTIVALPRAFESGTLGWMGNVRLTLPSGETITGDLKLFVAHSKPGDPKSPYGGK